MLHIFDLDGTLIESYINPKRPFARVAALPRRVEVLASLRQHGHTIAIATNQGGVAFGYNTEVEVQDKLSRALNALGLEPDMFVAVCYSDRRSRDPAYNQAADCARRKPSGAMLREAMAARPDAAREGVLYVGDRSEDEQAAQDAGVPFQWEREFFTTRPMRQYCLDPSIKFIANNQIMGDYMLGTIKIGNRILSEDVLVSIIEHESAPGAWSGSFAPDDNATEGVRAAVDAAEICRLQLDDGRAGDIILTEFTSIHEVTTAFTGIGPLA